MAEAKIYSRWETNILYPDILIEVTASGVRQHGCLLHRPKS